MSDDAEQTINHALGAWPADKVKRRKLDTLLPYANNSRTHSDEQIKQLANSIREWGWTVPVLVDEEGVLIAGHGRILAAHSLGLPDAPTMTAHGWSEEQKRAYRIADNKLALNAGWDQELLRIELNALRGESDLTLIGFTDQELKKLMAEASAPESFDTYDEEIETDHECPKCHYRWSGKGGAGYHAKPEESAPGTEEAA
jgi:ParB-like chromosome segregation protein Spo0J